MSKRKSLSHPKSFARGTPSGLLQSFWEFLPSGESLPPALWQSRHCFLLRLTWVHAVLIALIGLVFGYSREFTLEALFRNGTVLHAVAGAVIVGFFASIATLTTGRALSAMAVGFGLLSASAILIHFSGGAIELHFHFFVALAFLALYQDRLSYLAFIVYLVMYHAIVGAIWPEHVYNHTAAFDAPWLWAGVHSFFLTSAAVANMLAWRFNEKGFAQTTLILNSASDSIFCLDLHEKIIFMNSSAADLLRCRASEAAGKHIHEILRQTRADGSEFPNKSSSMSYFGAQTARAFRWNISVLPFSSTTR
jgi:methyl-accepting chemotaxis protein